MSEFLRPRLTGARFEGGAIPLEMLNELPALGEMIVAVAKWRYLQDHPQRQRIPRGFAESASLRLTGVEEGSAIPVIELASFSHGSPDAREFPGTPAVYGKYFEEAREYIIAAISAADRGEVVAYDLPEECLRYFDRFGRRLHEGESIEFKSSEVPTSHGSRGCQGADSSAPLRVLKSLKRYSFAVPSQRWTRIG